VSHQGRLLAPRIAHRGLWRAPAQPENSLAAFEAACVAGYGIELDIRLTADGEPIVFHDDSLDRMTRESGLVEERTADDLCALTLLGSDQHIPTLEQVLALVGGRALVLIELKTPPGQDGPLEARTAALLADYAGPSAILSFNADSLAWMAARAPSLARGLNVSAESDLLGMERAQPHFLSVSCALLEHPRIRDWHNAGRTLIAWTTRKATDADRLAGLADNLIFEGYRP
jgi:glycerophosphoryl diester phosphodiesterase